MQNSSNMGPAAGPQWRERAPGLQWGSEAPGPQRGGVAGTAMGACAGTAPPLDPPLNPTNECRLLEPVCAHV